VLKKAILALFWCAEFKSVVRFFPARQVLEINLKEYSRDSENVLFKWLGKSNGLLIQVKFA
jgi:hypothetical protein